MPPYPRHHRRAPPPHVRARGPEPVPRESARTRFIEWDDYRVEREWKRYEGTPLRDLYRELRERFLLRQRPTAPGRSLEIGPGPGRFTGLVGSVADRVAVLEMSRAMIDRLRAPGSTAGAADLVQGDALHPPFRSDRFHRVALLGNIVGFAGTQSSDLLGHVTALLAPGGRLLLEFVAGPGERSRYLHRLPPGAIARLFAAPVRAVLPRVLREGFEPLRSMRSPNRNFRRFGPDEVATALRAKGFTIRESLAVAPCLGNDAGRLAQVRDSPTAWTHLLELEELVGRQPERQSSAAAVLFAAERVETGPGPAQKAYD